MKRFLALLLIVSSFVIRHSSFAAEQRPNIIFILADDLGYTDVACFGSKYYETPNIDKLASQGLKLTSHHHCQNCQPTRAALMTGQYAPRTGVYTVGGIGRFDWQSRPLRPVDNVDQLPLDKVLIPQQLKAAGYATGMFGKWHLGNDKEHHPAARGFDEAIESSGKHFDFNTSPKTEYPKGTYLADFLTDHAEAFIRKHSRAERDSRPQDARRAGAGAPGNDHPFFLYLPHFGVHSPHQAKEDKIAHFKGKAPVGGHNSPVYAAMIASVDDSVGRVMKLLDELKLAENTIVIFSTDNGGVGGYSREGVEGGDITDNTPLRSGKGSLYEGGTRVPTIVRWPGVVKPGATCDTPTIHVDIFPTFLELANAKAPENQPLDGESLVPLFRDPSSSLKRDAIYQHFPGYLGAGNHTWRTLPVALVQSGPWKLMEFMEDKRVELYNLKDDIGEKTNLATTNPDKAKELLEKLHAWQGSIKAPMPAPNTEQKVAIDTEGKGKGKGKGNGNGKGKKKKKAAADE